MSQHNPEAAFKSTKRAPAVFIKTTPNAVTPVTWVDYALMIVAAFAVGFAVFVWANALVSAPAGPTPELARAAGDLCRSLEYTPSSPCADLLAKGY